MAIPFWQRSLSTLSFDDVKAFVSLDLSEDDHIEYKTASATTGTPKPDFDHKFCATVVAFANGGGGMILFGVTNGSPGKPREIVGELPKNGRHRDIEQAVADSCAVRIEPNLLLHVQSFTIPVGEPYAGNQILLIRVPAGPLPPYNVREHGIYIRGGKDGDRRAGVAEIQHLFELRDQLGPPEETAWSVVQRKVFTYLSESLTDYLPFLMVGVTPVFPIEPIAIDDRTDDRFQTLCYRMFYASHGSVAPEPDGATYTVTDNGVPVEHSSYACAYADGSAGARDEFSSHTPWATGRPVPQRLNVVHMWQRLRQMLEALAAWSREVGAYDGALTCRIALGNLEGTIAALPSEIESPAVELVRRHLLSTPVVTWQCQVVWDHNVDVDDLLEPVIAKLTRQLQFSQFRTFGSRIRAAVVR